MPMIHIRVSEDTYKYVVGLATLNGISLSSTANMLLTHCRKMRLGVGTTEGARADARTGAPEETPDDHN
jgi:hypothetical protein